MREYELSPDGRKIVFVGISGKAKGWEIYAINSEGSGRNGTTVRVQPLDDIVRQSRENPVEVQVLSSA